MSSFLSSPFGQLPSNWNYLSVETNIAFKTGPAFDSANFNIDGLGFRLVRGINLTKGTTRWGQETTKYWNLDLEEYGAYKLEEGDVLIGMDGSLVGQNYAYIKKSDLPSLLVQRVARLRTKKKWNQNSFLSIWNRFLVKIC